jgi:hypothetical protein
MRAEEGAVAVLAAELDRLGGPPGVAAHDGLLPAELVGLLDDERHLVVILRGEQHLRAGVDDLGQLGAEIGVLGGEALVGHHGTLPVDVFPRFLEELGQPLGIVGSHVVEGPPPS